MVIGCGSHLDNGYDPQSKATLLQPTKGGELQIPYRIPICNPSLLLCPGVHWSWWDSTMFLSFWSKPSGPKKQSKQQTGLRKILQLVLCCNFYFSHDCIDGYRLHTRSSRMENRVWSPCNPHVLVCSFILRRLSVLYQTQSYHELVYKLCASDRGLYQE